MLHETAQRMIDSKTTRLENVHQDYRDRTGHTEKVQLEGQVAGRQRVSDGVYSPCIVAGICGQAG